MEGEDESSLTQIMAAIQGCQNKLIDHFEELRMEFSFMKHDMQKLREKAQTTDRRVSSMEDTVRPLDTAAQVTKKTLSEYTLKMAVMEDCMRRNNIRLVGFLEGVEGKHPVEFLEKWLIDNMAPDTFTKMFAIESAHRIPGRAPTKGAPPDL